MAKRPSKGKTEARESGKVPPIVTGPAAIMSPEAFSPWMSYASSPDFLNEERLALLKRMSENLARDPALLKLVEEMLAEYGDEIYEISPNDAELAKFGFGWAGSPASGPPALVPPAAAAAALAPPAAAMAAAHAPGGD